MSERNILVGVYGTLKQGRGNHRLLTEADFMGQGLVSGFRLFQSGIPFLVEDETSNYKVLVELYKVNEQELSWLDSLEGHPYSYERKELRIEQGESSTVAWVYTYPERAGRENTTGVF